MTTVGGYTYQHFDGILRTSQFPAGITAVTVSSGSASAEASDSLKINTLTMYAGSFVNSRRAELLVNGELDAKTINLYGGQNRIGGNACYDVMIQFDVNTLVLGKGYKMNVTGATDPDGNLPQVYYPSIAVSNYKFDLTGVQKDDKLLTVTGFDGWLSIPGITSNNISFTGTVGDLKIGDKITLISEYPGSGVSFEKSYAGYTFLVTSGSPLVAEVTAVPPEEPDENPAEDPDEDPAGPEKKHDSVMDDVPKTGNEDNILPVVIVTALSLAGVVLVIIGLKRKPKETK